MPKSGVYTDLEDETNIRTSQKHYTDVYKPPPLASLTLKNPTEVLESGMEKVRAEQSF